MTYHLDPAVEIPLVGSYDDIADAIYDALGVEEGRASEDEAERIAADIIHGSYVVRGGEYVDIHGFD